MVEKITLQNFQSHEKTHIEFTNGLNCIIGQSDSGKTAILRALNLALKNRPSGDAYIMDGKESCCVEVAVNGKVVKREKGKGRNEYAVDGEKLTGFGVDVPELVEDAFKFTDVNFQYQMDAPFLLSLTPGIASQYINDIIGLSIIDDIISETQKRIRDKKSNIKAIEGNLGEFESDLGDISWLDVVEGMYDECLLLSDKLEQIESTNQDLLSVVNQLEQLGDLQEKFVGLGVTLGDFEGVQDSITKVEGIDEEINDLCELIDDLEAYQENSNLNELALKEMGDELAGFKVCEYCGSLIGGN